MNPMQLSAAATLLAIAIYFATMIQAGRVRHRTGLEAPAVVGNEEFERAYRVQMNTLEAMPIFLPLLWLATLGFGGWIPAALGGLWSVGRIGYMYGYLKSPNFRGPGFLTSMLAQAALFIVALWGLVRTL